MQRHATQEVDQVSDAYGMIPALTRRLALAHAGRVRSIAVGVLDKFEANGLISSIGRCEMDTLTENSWDPLNVAQYFSMPWRWLKSSTGSAFIMRGASIPR